MNCQGNKEHLLYRFGYKHIINYVKYNFIQKSIESTVM